MSRFLKKTTAFALAGGLVLVAAPAIAIVRYVDADALAGANNGTSWPNAFLELQDALSVAQAGDEIRVAQGVFRPDYDPGLGMHTGDRTMPFFMADDFVVRGGYAGFGEPNPDLRDLVAFETILTGDLNGDDLPISCTEDDDPVCDALGGLCLEHDEGQRYCILHTNISENSYNVVMLSDLGQPTPPTTVLDGFTITSGNADGDGFPFSLGGGIIAFIADPQLSNLTIRDCVAREEGGGMHFDTGSLTLTDCTFLYNDTTDGPSAEIFSAGGGLSTSNGSFPEGVVTIKSNFPTDSPDNKCLFKSNTSESGGGAELSGGGMFIIEDCTFDANVTRRFGGAGAHFRLPAGEAEVTCPRP